MKLALFGFAAVVASVAILHTAKVLWDTGLAGALLGLAASLLVCWVVLYMVKET